ncbi:phage replication protein [Limosilactobacillus coleohominis DSM 14060]|nr:phage replication protein [Limosilactobacillus coleohominis DSM 14060]
MKVNNNFEGSRLFLNIPVKVAHDLRFKSDKSILLFGEIFSMINVTGSFFMSTNKIAEKLRCSRGTVLNCIHELKELGYITTKQIKGNDGGTKGRQISLTPLVQSTVLPQYNSLDEGGITHCTQIKHTNKTNNKTNNIYSPAPPDHFSEQRKAIIGYLNQKLGSNYRPSSAKAKRHIDARLNEGFKLDDFKRVIDIKISDWANDRNMARYLRPETLFGTKFESYLNQQDSC